MTETKKNVNGGRESKSERDYEIFSRSQRKYLFIYYSHNCYSTFNCLFIISTFTPFSLAFLCNYFECSLFHHAQKCVAKIAHGGIPLEHPIEWRVLEERNLGFIVEWQCFSHIHSADFDKCVTNDSNCRRTTLQSKKEIQVFSVILIFSTISLPCVARWMITVSVYNNNNIKFTFPATHCSGTSELFLFSFTLISTCGWGRV